MYATARAARSASMNSTVVDCGGGAVPACKPMPMPALATSVTDAGRTWPAAVRRFSASLLANITSNGWSSPSTVPEATSTFRPDYVWKAGSKASTTSVKAPEVCSRSVGLAARGACACAAPTGTNSAASTVSHRVVSRQPGRAIGGAFIEGILGGRRCAAGTVRREPVLVKEDMRIVAGFAAGATAALAHRRGCSHASAACTSCRDSLAGSIVGSGPLQ